MIVKQSGGPVTWNEDQSLILNDSEKVNSQGGKGNREKEKRASGG